MTDTVRGGRVLLGPERIVRLNRSAAAILDACDGERTEDEVIEHVERKFRSKVSLERDVRELLGRLAGRGVVRGVEAIASIGEDRDAEDSAMLPEVLLAEVTHRCPLRCGYCSNPIELTKRKNEISSAVFARALDQAADLGVLQAHFSGGEPLLRAELEDWIARASGHGIYTNLITSTHGLDGARWRALLDAGLDHVQVSIQHVDARVADSVAGIAAHDSKMRALQMISETKQERSELALSLNVVLHRESVAQVEAFVQLAHELGADRIELASMQLHGWGAAHHGAMAATREELERAAQRAATLRDELRGELDVVFVPTDGLSPFPKACMGGWGRRYLVIAPDGRLLPCPGAYALEAELGGAPRLSESSELGALFASANVFEAFRGQAWMNEPCRSCDRRDRDFGGCRCQAHRVLGDRNATDPACSKSPAHPRFVQSVFSATRPAPPEPVYRLAVLGESS